MMIRSFAAGLCATTALTMAEPALAGPPPSVTPAFSNTNSIPGVINWGSSQLQNLQDCYARVQSPYAPSACTMVLVSDSTGRGHCADANCVDDTLHSWFTDLAAKQAAAGIPTSTDSFYGCSNETTPAACASLYNGTLSLGTGWAVGQGGFGGEWIEFPANTTPAPLTFTPVVTPYSGLAYNQVDSEYISGIAAGVTVVDRAGTAPTSATVLPLSTGAPCSVSGVTVTQTVGTLGICKVTMTWSTTATGALNFNAPNNTTPKFYVLGARERNTAIPRVEMENGAWGGSSSYSWSTAGAYNGYGGIYGLKALAPKVTFLALGINDWATGTPTTIPNYNTYMGQLVAAGQLTGDVINIFQTQSDPVQTGVSLATQQTYDAAMQSFGLPHLDFNKRWNNWASASTLCFMGNTTCTDSRHPSAKGYEDQASFVWAAINAVIH